MRDSVSHTLADTGVSVKRFPEFSGTKKNPGGAAGVFAVPILGDRGYLVRTQPLSAFDHSY